MTIIKSSQSFETDQKNTVQAKDICKFFAIPNSNVTFAKYFSVYSNMHPEARKELIRIWATTIGLEHKRLLGKVDPDQPKPKVLKSRLQKSNRETALRLFFAFTPESLRYLNLTVQMTTCSTEQSNR